MSTLVKATLAEQAYQELRSRIVSGRLAGGTRLLPNELAEDLGISPTPVKEACARLESDGLVVASSRRGMVVRRMTLADIEELYDARLLLERASVERVFELGRVDDALITDLEESFELHRRHANAETLDELAMALAHDRQFHHAIVSRAGIGMVSDWHDRILSQTHTVFVSVPGHYERSIGDHRAILDAVTARSLERTLEMIDEHLTNSRANARLLVSRLDQVVVEAS
jgi:DNA-binding GntR family transcriptional regulator